MLFQLIIIQVVTFFAIVFVLKKLLYTETAKEAQRLKVLKEENYQKQKELQEKIESAESAYREKMAKAEEEIRRQHIREEEEIEKLKRKVLDKAKGEAEQIVQSAFNVKEKIREEIGLEMRKKSPELAFQIFKEVLSPDIKGMIHKELVKEVINQVKQLDDSRFNIKIKKGELVSAYSLEKSEKDMLLSIISEKLGYKISFEEKEDDMLIAGFIIRLGTLVIDGSLENRLREMEKDLK